MSELNPSEVVCDHFTLNLIRALAAWRVSRLPMADPLITRPAQRFFSKEGAYEPVEILSAKSAAKILTAPPAREKRDTTTDGSDDLRDGRTNEFRKKHERRRDDLGDKQESI